MKKRLLALGTLAIAFSANAQFISYVGNEAKVYVKTDALVYNGGGVKTVASGLIDNSGNIMVVGNATTKFATVDANGGNKTDGGNIILRMTAQDIAQGLRYGQLYIKGLAQNNITGVVDKQYKDAKHGSYQQIALPFHNKNLSELDAELGKTFSNDRWSQDEMLLWTDRYVRMDVVDKSNTTSYADWSEGRRFAKTAYYALGSKKFDASAGVKTIKGTPYADNVSITMQDAGKDINFGDNGSARNRWGEFYNTYLQDYFDYSNSAWRDKYGKNIYQFGNPFLTNLDIKYLGQAINNIQGVRIEPSGVTTLEGGSTYSTSAKYITYTASGVATGDNTLTMIRPMSTFVIKLKNENASTLNLDDLRRFKYTSRAENTPYVGVNTMSDGVINGGLSTMSKSVFGNSNSSVKQLAVIALDNNGEELGRTYYVVYSGAISGQPTVATTQVIAGANNVIGTFEELKNGGIDNSLTNSYWLYINEANENDFRGKEIPLRMYDDKIKSLKFEIQENAEFIAKGQEKLSSGESFYIGLGDNKFVALGNENTIALASTDGAFGLYYGKPASAVVDDVVIEKPSATFVAYDTNAENYKLVFDSTWKTAFVQVFDMAGRLVISQNNVDATQHYAINLPAKGAYVVTAISESGKKFSQKIVK